MECELDTGLYESVTQSLTANKDRFITQAINVGCIAINGGYHSYVHVHIASYREPFD